LEVSVNKNFLIKRQVVDFFIIAVSLKFGLCPCAKSKITWCCFFAIRLG